MKGRGLKKSERKYWLANALMTALGDGEIGDVELVAAALARECGFEMPSARE